MPTNFRTNLGSVTREEGLVFINSGQLVGLQSANLAYETNSQEYKYIGMGKCNNLPVGPRVGTFDVSYYILADETILPHTGNSGVNGYIIKNRSSFADNYSFSSGYLTNYSTRAAIGEIPQANASFVVFNNIGKFELSESTQVNADWTRITADVNTLYLKPTAPNAISLTLNNNFRTNRVISYQLNISIPRSPVYVLARPTPIAVNYVPPMLVEANFVIERNDYNADKLSNYPFLNPKANLRIELRDFFTNIPVVVYNFDKMELKSETYSLNVENRNTFQLNYRSYYI